MMSAVVQEDVRLTGIEARAAAECLAKQRGEAMSQENVEVVRRLYGAYTAANLAKVIRAVCDPDIEWHAAEGFGVLRGRDAVISHFESFRDAFDGWQVEAEDVIDAGDEIIGVTRARGSGRASKVGLDARYAIVFDLRANLIVRAREYPTRTEALEAAGLEG